MEVKFNKSTDAEEEVKLESTLIYADWCLGKAFSGEAAEVEVRTCFVGNGATIKISGTSGEGKKLGKTKGKIRNNLFVGTLDIPDDVEIGDTVTFEVDLSDNGLSGKSTAIPVVPPITVTNMKWDKEVAHRGDVLTLTADVGGVRDGTEAVVTIYEFDRDSAHDRITELTTEVREDKLEVSWEYEYHEDTDELPTQEELDEYGGSYNPPEYFFMVTIEGKCFGKEQESGILEFKDYLEIRLLDGEGNPKADERYKIKFADGSEKEGQLDGKGTTREEDIPPGAYRVEFPDSPGFGRRETQSAVEEDSNTATQAPAESDTRSATQSSPATSDGNTGTQSSSGEDSNSGTQGGQS